MRLKHVILLSYGLFLLLAVAGIVAFLVVITHYGHLHDSVQLLLWVCSGLLIFVSVWITFVLAQLIAHPLERIAGAARSIAAGRFDVRVGAARYHEGNTLGSSFNEMAEALAAFHALDVAKLISEQRRNEIVLNSIDDGLVILDEEARIERINPIAARQFGVDARSAIGHTPDAVLQRNDIDERTRIDMRKPAQADVLEFTIGEGLLRRELHVSLIPFVDVRPGLVLVVHDVTAERRFARERNEFVMRASHELRTPLTGLRMALDLMAEGAHFAPGTREAELMATLLEETARMTVLLQSLLDLSRLRGGGAASGAPSSPALIIEQAMRRFAARALAQEVSLRAHIAENLPETVLDQNECARVIDNLLDNALRHTPAGGNIVVSASIDANDGELEICIADSGVGIAPQQLERIFEPFVQVGDKPGGAGLGLTLCREIVESRGGRISARSNPGKETVFCVRLPLQTGGE